MSGCGADGSALDPPELRFHGPCQGHDDAYLRPGTVRERFEMDHAFLQEMRFKADRAPLLTQPLYRAAATGYYLAVRFFGWAHFNYTGGKRK